LEQHLYWVDIEGHAILRANGYTGVIQTWPLPAQPGCIAPIQGGGLVMALRDGVYTASTWRGELHRLLPSPYDPSTTRFNDGKCDPQGRFWAGTMYEPRDQALGVLYALDARMARAGALALQAKAHGATIANGLAWSPDQRTLYWTDTTRHCIRAWDWDALGNGLSNERVFHQFAPKPVGWVPGMPGYGGRPDGAAVDTDGNYWVAMYEGGRVLQLSPQGAVMREIATPALCPTMPCFGGDDLKTLYLTTVRHQRSEKELAQYPDSGCVFSMRVSVPGLPVNFFLPGV
jgi:sugar lactone lactonase YvrE